jgi:hypothetical protein
VEGERLWQGKAVKRHNIIYTSMTLKTSQLHSAVFFMEQQMCSESHGIDRELPSAGDHDVLILTCRCATSPQGRACLIAWGICIWGSIIAGALLLDV